MLHRFLITALCLGLLMVTAAPAMAQSVTQGYDESGVIGNIDETPEVIPADDDDSDGEIVPTDDNTPTARETGAAPGAGELPFTGFEAGMIAAVGLMLLGTGLVLRRSQRQG